MAALSDDAPTVIAPDEQPLTPQIEVAVLCAQAPYADVAALREVPALGAVFHDAILTAESVAQINALCEDAAASSLEHP